MSNDAVPERDAILDRMTEAFFALNSDREFTYLNPEAQEIICNAIGETRSIDTLKGQHIWDEIPDAVDTKFYEQYEQAFATQEPRSL